MANYIVKLRYKRLMIKETPTTRRMTADEKRLSAMFKALGNPVRFQIMQILAEKQMCITGEIVEFTLLAQSTVSQHLNTAARSRVDQR